MHEGDDTFAGVCGEDDRLGRHVWVYPEILGSTLGSGIPLVVEDVLGVLDTGAP